MKTNKQTNKQTHINTHKHAHTYQPKPGVTPHHRTAMGISRHVLRSYITKILGNSYRQAMHTGFDYCNTQVRHSTSNHASNLAHIVHLHMSVCYHMTVWTMKALQLVHTKAGKLNKQFLKCASDIRATI